MRTPILTVRDLVKRYGPVTAVDGVSFDVYPGEVFGLLGPNGAGKTTALECVEGLRVPSAGSIAVDGLHPKRDSRRLRRVLGVQLQASALPETMLAGEAMALVCAWHGVKTRQDLLERFGMLELKNRPFGKMSTGQKRRLQLALALAGNPKIVVLDEPTAGVDVQGRAELHGAIRELKAAGVTLILATHDMAEAETLCDRIAILIGGRLATLGTPEQVTAAGSAQTRITVRTRRGSLLRQGDIRLSTYLREAEGFAQWLCRDTAPAVMELLSAAVEAEDPVEDLRVERPSLEERFLEMVEGGKSA
ncbi:MAG: ABC transporter ATP-binding protein [Christensenellales bacterium]|jgi:ABC-2 type transport system ATP-binding protein